MGIRRQLTEAEKVTLAAHAAWLRFEPQGVRAVLSGADLSGAVLSGADLPKVEHLDARILEAVTSGGGTLDMATWHTCKTTHCRAGWAIHLAGEAGAKLEEAVGPCAAGAHHASTGRIPDFYATTSDALDDLRKCAGE